MSTKSTTEAVDQILEGLQTLILSGRTLIGNEQYSPLVDVDASDESIARCRERVKELRAIRERFETLMTGGLD